MSVITAHRVAEQSVTAYQNLIGGRCGWQRKCAAARCSFGYGAGGGIELHFGGVKKSGHGREKGIEALREFSQAKTIVFKHG